MLRICSAFVLLQVQCVAQAPFDGMSKTTLAAETDPLRAMAFVQKYFGATPDSDSCASNVCLCNAGDSNASKPWRAVLGRSDLVRKGFPAGQCVLRTSVASQVPATEGVVAVTPGGSLGVDCTYKESHKIDAAAGDAGYTVHAHDADTCCKSCAALATCVGATYIPAANGTEVKSSSRMAGPPTYEGFGLHLPAINGHSTQGGLSVREVEEIVSNKLGVMDKFDAWLDFNAALYTSNLDSYLERFSVDKVPYLGATWKTPDGALMFSAFVLVPTSTMVIELMGSTSTILTHRISKLTRLEQRLSATRLQALADSPPTTGLLQPVRVSRSVSKVSAIDEFYLGAMRLNLTLSVDEHGVQSRCYLWPGGNADVCFVQRRHDATSGHLTVAGFEAMLKRVIETVVTNPWCMMNRWADNHYAIDLLDDKDKGKFDYIVDYLEANPGTRYQCADFGVPGLHYVYDPTGWAVQVNFRFNKQPSGCSSSSPSRGSAKWLHQNAQGGNPMCGGGTCHTEYLVV